MDTDEWWDSPVRRWGGPVRWQATGHGKWSRASWADQLEEEGADADDGVDPPPPARRRLDATDTQQAAGESAQQQPQQPAPSAAEGGKTGGNAGDDPATASKKHAERISRIVTMAIDAGVTPLTAKGEELCLLDATQLEAWVAEHLPSALLC
jgi:hypothetical protein